MTTAVSSEARAALDWLTLTQVTLAGAWQVRVYVSVDVPTFRTVNVWVNPFTKLPRVGPLPLAGVTETACRTLGQIVKLSFPGPRSFELMTSCANPVPLAEPFRV